jgi:hypothetical protein
MDVADAHLCNTCHDVCDSDNAICCAACTSSFIHDNCLIKSGRDKSAKKVQGAAPTWLREVLHNAGIRYFCSSCIPNLDFIHAKASTQHSPQKIVELEAKINAIDNKVDLLLSTLVESAQPAADTVLTANQSIPQTKPLYSKIAAQAPTRDLLKDVISEVISSRDHTVVQDTSVVLIGVPASKDDAKTVSDIMSAINCACRIVKIQRLGRNTNTATLSTTQSANRVPPLLVTFQTELDRSNVIHNAKLLSSTSFNKVFVRKWLSKDELHSERILRAKCNKLNDSLDLNSKGQKPFIMIDGHIRERLDDGRINYKKSIDVDSLLLSHPKTITADSRN